MMTTIDKELHDELKELIEDSIEYFCDQNMVSGEIAWIITECLAVSKQAQLKGLVK
jgi:hypothetical protein